MQKFKGVTTLCSVLIMAALACSFPQARPTPEIDTDATLTSVAQTQNAGGPQSSATETASFTPTDVPTTAPEVTTVTVSVSVDTNCRKGPGVVYDYLTALLVGEQAEVVGKYTSTNPPYWVIKKGSVTCWLWGQYATVVGDINTVPEMIPPPSPVPPPTDTPTPTPTPATPPATGDLRIIEIFMSTQFEVVTRVGTNPTGSLSGNYQYTVYSNGSQVAQGSCTVPTGSHACWSGYKVTGVESIQVVIDSNNTITESNESNNSLTVTCDKSGLTCN